MLQPIPPNKRLEHIDVARGFALFGIFAVNIFTFALADPLQPWSNFTDRLISQGVGTFFSGKFITIFTILFGIGFGIQRLKQANSDQDFTQTFRRRQFGLLTIGLLHAIFLSSQDILFFYAILGFALWPLRNLTARSLIFLSIALYVTSYVPDQFARIAIVLGDRAPTSQTLVEIPANHSYTSANEAEEVSYLDTDFFKVTQHRFQEFLSGPTFTIERYWRKLPFFLFGYYLVIFGNLAGRIVDRRFLLRIAMLSGAIGLTGRSLLYFCYLQSAPDWALLLRLPLAAIANPSLALCYVSALLYVFNSSTGRLVLYPLTYAGRMALTNYILQSVLATVLFYGYGFGLFGKIEATELFLIAVGSFVLQVLLSYLWLSWFRYGPLEWIWRSFTYMSWQRIRR